MYCTNCGAKIPDGAKYCTNCGTPVSASEALLNTPNASPAPEVQSQPVQEPVTQPMQELQAEPAAAAGSVPLYTPAEKTADGPAPQTETAFGGTVPPATGGPEAFPAYGNAGGSGAAAATPAKKGGRKILGIIAAVLVLAIAVGTIFGKGSGGKSTGLEDSQEYEDAKTALESGDYDAALDLLEDLHSKDPDSKQIYHSLLEAYLFSYYDLYGNGDFTGAEQRLFRYYEIAEGADAEDRGEMLDNFYFGWLYSIIEGTDGSDYDEVYSRAEPYLTEETKELLVSYAIEASYSGPSIAYGVNPSFDAEISPELTELAGKIASAAATEQFMDMPQYMIQYTDALEAALSGNNDRPIAMSEDTLEGYPYIIFYRFPGDAMFEDGFAAYYGPLDEDGYRSGMGFWIYGKDVDETNYNYYIFLSYWDKNQPNGAFVEIETDSSGIYQYKGTLVDGYYHGEQTETINGVAFTVDYDNGHIQVIERTDDGRNIVGICVSGGDADDVLVLTDDALLDMYGVNYVR